MKPSLLWIAVAAFVAVVALSFHLILRGRRGQEARGRLDALDRALAEGVIDDAEFVQKRKAVLALPAAPLARRSAWPVYALAALVPFCGVLLLFLALGAKAPPPAPAPAPTRTGETAAPAAPAAPGAATSMSDAITNLERRLQANPPGSVDDWLLLGRAYVFSERFEEGKKALKRAVELAPDNPDAAAEYAEALALAAPDRIIGKESRSLLEKTLAAHPQHPRTMWLLGIADSQSGNVQGAIARWEALLPLLQPDSDILAQVKVQLAEARTGTGQPPAAKAGAAAPTPAAVSPPAAAAGGASLKVDIDIAPALAARLAPTDVLFVFARAPSGSRMPLAMQRIPGAKFPLTVVLDDSTGMLPSMKLSSAPQVVVGARVSKSGIANAQSGDLEVLSAPVSVSASTAPIKLVIDHVVP